MVQETSPESQQSVVGQQIFYLVLLYFAINYGSGSSSKSQKVAPRSTQGKSLWSVGEKASMYIFLSPSEQLHLVNETKTNSTKFLRTSSSVTLSNATWSFQNITFDFSTGNELNLHLEDVENHLGFRMDENILESYFLHVLYTRRGYIPRSFETSDRSVVYLRQPLIHYKESVAKPTHSLLGEELEGATSKLSELRSRKWTTTKGNTTLAAHWKPTIACCPVVDDADHTETTTDMIVPFITQTPDKSFYYPILYPNALWDRQSEYTRLDTREKDNPLSLSVSIYPISFTRFTLLENMLLGLEGQKSWGITQQEVDDMKSIFTDTNPYFLALTIVVSLLHMFFEYLAFKNDISFWKDREDFTGLSVRTLCVNAYFQLIITLYLWDNDTSWTVLLPSIVGLLIEIWKLRKLIRVRPKQRGWLPFRFELVEEYGSTKTNTIDDQATRILGYILVPALLAYATHCALYEKYTGWYSFAIQTQVSFIYAAGFVLMTPQLFINYKLKSVAHLPWRTFVYKALNTVVDDFFAFIIKMPWLHRLACFRDDLVFLVLLYQKWIYPVDYARANEFGQVGEKMEELKTDEEHTKTNLGRTSIESITEAQENVRESDVKSSSDSENSE